MKKLPLVSIIIPTLNCERNLAVCLASLKKQNYKNIEIIVVDQNSSDGTIKVAQKYGSTIKKVKKPKFYSPPSHSRNIGASIAKGQIFYHVDSDMEIPQKLISEFVDIFEKNAKIGACIVHETDMTNNFWGRCKALERRCYWGNDMIESARVVRKKIFFSVKGYDEHIRTGEDFDIHRKYKEICSIAFCSTPIYHHVEDCTYLSLVLKKFNYGKTARKFFNGVNIPWYKLIFAEFKSYSKNYKLLIDQPFVAFGMFILKISELVLGLCGMIIKTF